MVTRGPKDAKKTKTSTTIFFKGLSWLLQVFPLTITGVLRTSIFGKGLLNSSVRYPGGLLEIPTENIKYMI